MFTFLQGYRTYILVGAAAVVFVMQLTGHMNATDANQLYVMLGFGSVAALRSGIDNAK